MQDASFGSAKQEELEGIASTIMVKVCQAAGEPAGMPAILCGEVDARVTRVHEEESISFSPFL